MKFKTGWTKEGSSSEHFSVKWRQIRERETCNDSSVKRGSRLENISSGTRVPRCLWLLSTLQREKWVAIIHFSPGEPSLKEGHNRSHVITGMVQVTVYFYQHL